MLVFYLTTKLTNTLGLTFICLNAARSLIEKLMDLKFPLSEIEIPLQLKLLFGLQEVFDLYLTLKAGKKFNNIRMHLGKS